MRHHTSIVAPCDAKTRLENSSSYLLRIFKLQYYSLHCLTTELSYLDLSTQASPLYKTKCTRVAAPVCWSPPWSRRPALQLFHWIHYLRGVNRANTENRRHFSFICNSRRDSPFRPPSIGQCYAGRRHPRQKSHRAPCPVPPLLCLPYLHRCDSLLRRLSCILVYPLCIRLYALCYSCGGFLLLPGSLFRTLICFHTLRPVLHRSCIHLHSLAFRFHSFCI